MIVIPMLAAAVLLAVFLALLWMALRHDPQDEEQPPGAEPDTPSGPWGPR